MLRAEPMQPSQMRASQSDVDTLFYHQALAELSRTARAFSHAIVDAAAAAKKMGARDDLIALRTFEECRAALLGAFARAPGMMQLFTGGK